MNELGGYRCVPDGGDTMIPQSSDGTTPTTSVGRTEQPTTIAPNGRSTFDAAPPSPPPPPQEIPPRNNQPHYPIQPNNQQTCRPGFVFLPAAQRCIGKLT